MARQPQDKDYSRTHPDYDRMLKRWIMAYDFFRGGAHVLQPAQKVTSISWTDGKRPSNPDIWDQNSASTLATPGGASAFEWFSAEVNSYIWKHERERLREYQRRQAAAYHIPLFRPLCNVLASAVLKTGPERTVTAPLWSDYLRDVDLTGTPIGPFMRQALTLGLVFGRIHAVTDMTRPGDGAPAPSLAAQRSAGVRAYSYLVMPFDLTNWSLDEHGNFVWAIVREDAPDERDPGDPDQGRQDQYRVWTRTDWQLWRCVQAVAGTAAAWWLVDAGPNPIGRVPIQTLYCHRGSRTLFGCESPLADIVDIDRTIFNKLSQLDELISKGTFSILALPRRDGGAIGDLEVGPGIGLVFDAEAGVPLYISPDAAQAAGLWAIIKDLFSSARVSAEVGRGVAEESMEARSAAAIGAESSDKHNVMASLAEATEQFERGLYADVAAWEGVSSVPDVAYSRKFDLRSTNQQIADVVALARTRVSPRAVEMLTRPIVGKFMRELGATDDEVREATNATVIDDEPEPVVSSPEFPISQDEAADRRGMVS